MSIALIVACIAAGFLGGLAILGFDYIQGRLKKILYEDDIAYIELEEWAGSKVYSCSELVEDNTCALGYEGCLKCPVFQRKLLQTSSKFRNYYSFD